MRSSAWSSDVCSSDLGRSCAFQVLQASAGNPGRAAPAKGLTGQGYEGHHLWDQEVFVTHALDLLAPEASRVLLGFRHRTLPQARLRARDLSLDGAQFPWRTIDRSEEHTSELQSLMRISYAVFCLKKKKHTTHHPHQNIS